MGIVGWARALLLALVLLGGGAALDGAALAQRPGQVLLERLANGLVPGLHMEGLGGTILGGTTIARITLSDSRGPYLVLEDIRIDLRLGSLFSREVRASRVSAARVAFTRLPVADPNAPATPDAPADPNASLLPELPVDVAIEELLIERLELGEAVAGTPAALRLEAGGRLSGEGVFVGLRARRLDAEGALDADVAISRGNHLKVNLSFSEPAGGLVAGLLGLPPAPAEARIALDGPAAGAALELSARVGDTLRVGATGTLALPAGGGFGIVARGEARAPGLLPAPLTGGSFEVDLRPEGDGLLLNRLLVQAEQGRIEASGPIGENTALRLSARLGDGASFGALLPPGLGWAGLDLDGTVSGRTADPTVEARVALRGPRIPQAPPDLVGPALSLDLRGDLRRIERLEVAGAGIALSASGAYRDPLDLRVAGRMGDARALGALLPAGIGWSSLEVGGTVSGTTAAPTADLRAVVNGPRLPNAPPEALGETLTATLRTDAARIERLTLEAAAVSLSASGSYRDPLDLRLTGRVGDARALGSLLPPDVGWSALEVEGGVSGTLAAPVIDAVATMRGPRLPEPAPGLLGQAPTLSLRAGLERIERLELRGAGLSLDARGRHAEPMDLSATVALANADTTGQPVRGRLDAALQVRGAYASPAVEATVTSPRLDAFGRRLEALRLEVALARAVPPDGRATLRGRLDGLPLSLDARSALEGTLLRVEALDAALGPARLRGRGTLDTATTLFTGEAGLEADDLRPLSGLAGTPLAGAVRVNATLAPAANGVQGLRAEARLTGAGPAGKPVSGTVSANGNLAALDTVLALTLPQGGETLRAGARARLNLLGPDRRVDLAALDVARGPLGVRLQSPGAVVLPAAGGVEIPGLVLAGRPGGTLRVAGRWGPERADIRATLAALPASVANLFLPEPPLQGTLSADVRATGAVSAPSVDAELRADGLRAAASWASGIPPATIRATARLRGEAATLQATAGAGTATRLTLDAALPRGFAADSPLRAGLRGDADLGALANPFLAAGADRVTGRLNIDARVDGTVGQPRPGGTATLSGGSYRNLEYGVALREVAARLRGDASGDVVIEQLSARGGEGTVQARGRIGLLAAGMPVDVSVTARDFTPAASDLFTGTLNADLTLGGGMTSGARFGGRLVMRTATVNLPNALPGGVVDLEVRERGRAPPGTRPTVARRAAARSDAAPSPPAPPIALDLALSVPGRFYVRGRGLNAELGGDLRVGGTVAAPDVTGALSLRRGVFEIFDRRLNFRRGELRFTGGPPAPDLDFLAIANVQSTEIQITVTGTPAAPKIAFSSSPELPQDEVLARLIFNRSTDRLSPFQIAQLAQAVAGATGLVDAGSGGSLLDRAARMVGIDTRAIGGVYLDVDPGTGTGEPRVGVQVEITPRLRLESSAGTDGQRAGVAYEYEY